MESKRKARRQRHQKKARRRELNKQLNNIIGLIQKNHEAEKVSVAGFDNEVFRPLQKAARVWYEEVSEKDPELLNFIVSLNPHLVTQTPS